MDYHNSNSSFKQKSLITAMKLGIGVATILVIGVGSFGAFENLEADQLMVIQSPLSGDLSVSTEPGMKWQGWGKVTKYPRQSQYSFCSNNVQTGVDPKDRPIYEEQKCSPDDNSLAKRLRFNDGGHAKLSGAIIWEMPLDPKSIIEIHKKFGSEEGIEQRGVGKMLDASIYLAGPLMSSTESSGARRSELVQFISDQAENGVYATRVKNEVSKDLAGNDVTTQSTEIIRNAKGNIERQQGSILSQFNITLLPLAIQRLDYDAVVERQIAQRQDATTQVQIKRAEAIKAEQDAITIEANGRAAAAKTKWEQEKLNAGEIAAAQKNLSVATLKAQEAEQYKKEQTLRGEGEAARKRAVMQADGALSSKLEAYVKTQEMWANAFKDYSGNLVPQVMMGGNAGGSSNAAMTAGDLMTMIGVKTAKDLALDLGNMGNRSAKSEKK